MSSGCLASGRVDLVRHDRRDVVREDERPRAVGLLEVHRDRRRVGRLDRLQRGQQRCTGRVGSAILSMRSSENLTSSDVSGSPLENFRSGLSLQTYVFGSRELAALGRVRLGLVAARRNRQQVLVHVADQLLGAEVVCPDRVQRDDLVGRAEDDGVSVALRGLGGRSTAAAAAVVVVRAAARCCADGKQRRAAEYGHSLCAHIFRPPPMGTGSTSTSPTTLWTGGPRSGSHSSETATRQPRPASQPGLVGVGTSQRWMYAHQARQFEARVQREPVRAALEADVDVIASIRCNR